MLDEKEAIVGRELTGLSPLLFPSNSGFGLRCAPMLHHIFTACGIKDISAKLYGSMNVMQCVKAMAHILHGGVSVSGLTTLSLQLVLRTDALPSSSTATC